MESTRPQWLNPIATAPTRRAATAAKPSTAAAAAAPTPVVAKGAKKEAALPPRPEVTAKQKLAELAAQARREIGLSGTGAGIAHVGSKGDLSGLTSGPGGLSKAVGASAAPSAWGKPAAAEPAPINLQPPTLAQLPQLQQLLQQAANKKAAASRTVAAQAAASSLAAKPPPAVPQPVLNPPTPMWPALSSAASMPAPSGGQSGGQTPRESTTRPASPPTATPGPTAWGPSASLATAASAPAPAGPAAAPGQQQIATAAAAPAPSAKPSGASAAPTQAPQSQPAAGTQASTPVSKPAGQSAAVSSRAGAGQGTAEGASGSGTAESEAAAGGSAAAAGAAGLAGTGAGPSRPAAATASAAAAEVPAAGGTPSRQLVGAEYTDEEAREPKLTKAQRKNLKRAEKKKTPAGGDADGEEGGGAQEGADGQQRGRQLSPSGSGTSRGGTAGGAAGGSQHKRHGSEDPEQAQRAVQAEEAAMMEELCINCIVARKVLTLMAQLQRLGVADFIAAAAIQRHGSNLLAALEWLLVAGADAASQPAQKVLAAAAESASASDVEIDISQELQQLGDLQAAMGLPAELLQQCVLDCNGDVQTAATSAMDRMLRPQGGDAGGGDCAAAGDGRVRAGSSSGSNSGTSAGGGQQAGGTDGGAGRQSDTQVSHFGVRLQDEPAEQGSAAGSYRTASPSAPPGFGGLGGYGAGLLRGSLGGWQNGFLGDPMPLQELGLGGGAADAAEAGTGGRSTSRLSHWLKEDPGRAAASPSACKANGPRAPNGLLGPQDPVLDTPFGVQQHGGKPSDTPSLGTWLGSNGYHGGAGPAGGANGPTGLAPHESYGNHSGFSFMTALSKPTLSMGGSQALGEGLHGEYGQYGQWGAQQPGSGRLFAGGGTGAGPAGEADGGQQQGDNSEELSSIMALVNVR